MQLNKQNIINQLLRGTNEQITAKDLAIITHCIYNPDQKLYSLASKESKDKLSSKFPSLDIVSSIYNEMKSTPFFKDANNRFTFIDLFAGIGGFRIALQNLGGKCIYSSEWDKFAQRTYFTNFGEVPFGDITLEETKQEVGMTIESIDNIEVAHILAQKYDVEMPIVETVYEVLYKNLDPKDAVNILMTRKLKTEKE